MSQSKDLLFKLLYADSEEAVDTIINNDREMKESANWHPLDDRITNFNVVNNQSSNGAKAATELMTNMVDAILMKKCHERGINPKGNDAPKTMYQAVDKFIFNLNGGKIVNADKRQLQSFAEENLIIGVTGGRKKGETKPCFTFCDNGEGQHPENFSETFLSLRAKYKSEIRFVQGKYNMGSSGVLGFCGSKWYKLILSRRYDKTGDWGWTLLRKKEAESGDYVEYFAPDKQIKKFEQPGLIIPFKTGEGEEYNEFKLESGTIVKLYEYFLGKSYTHARGAREAFNENLVETILPFRIWDFRWPPEQGRGKERAVGLDSRSFYGMEYLLLRSHAEEQVDESEEEISGEKIDIRTAIRGQLGKIHISAIVIKKSKETTGWYKNSNNRVFHHVNGQVQYKDGRGLLTNCGLAALKDRVVIFVDASELTNSAHQGLWKGDREAIRETEIGELYKARIKDILKKSRELKKLNHRITQEELETVAQDNSRKLIHEIIKKDDNFRFLLGGRAPDIPTPGLVPVDPKPRDDLKHDPTYIRLLSRGNIELPINRSRPIPFDTDADDDFFQRTDYTGNLKISDDKVVENFEHSYILNNGKLVLFLDPYKVQVGDEYKFKVCLESGTMPLPVCLEQDMCIKIISPSQRTPSPSPHPRPTPPPEGRSLPQYRLLTKDGRAVMDEESSTSWQDFECYKACNETDGGYIDDLGEEKKYYINYDNVFFQSYLKKAGAKGSVIEKKYILGMRILMLGMEYGISEQEKRTPEFLSESIDEVRRAIAQGAAAVVLTLVHQLPESFDLFRDMPEGSDDN